MKPLERIPIQANVLIVACERPVTEIGKLVKAVVTYTTKGVKPSMDDIRLETYFGLIAQDLDAQRTVAGGQHPLTPSGCRAALHHAHICLSICVTGNGNMWNATNNRILKSERSSAR